VLLESPLITLFFSKLPKLIHSVKVNSLPEIELLKPLTSQLNLFDFR